MYDRSNQGLEYPPCEDLVTSTGPHNPPRTVRNDLITWIWNQLVAMGFESLHFLNDFPNNYLSANIQIRFNAKYWNFGCICFFEYHLE